MSDTEKAEVTASQPELMIRQDIPNLRPQVVIGVEIILPAGHEHDGTKLTEDTTIKTNIQTAQVLLDRSIGKLGRNIYEE